MEIKIDFKEVAIDIAEAEALFLGNDAWTDIEVAVRNGLNTVMPITSAESLAKRLVR